MLFISHRLEEVFAICQRVTVMRDGRFVRTGPIDGPRPSTTSSARWSAATSPRCSPRPSTAPGRGRCSRSSDLTREGVFTDVSLHVRAGEIVALAGLVGAGRSEVARAIFGIDRYDAGTVDGRRQRAAEAARRRAAMAAGVGFVPEDRRQQGLVMDMAIDHNVALASLSQPAHGSG